MSTELATTVHTKAMPSQLRRLVAQWYGTNIANGGDASTLVKLHASAAVEGVRETGVAGVQGAILGAFHALSPTGLDVKIPGTTHKVPADLVGALVGLAASVGAASAPHGLGKSVQSMGAACMAVFSFRQTNDALVKMREKKTGATQASNRVISKSSFGAEGGWAAGSRASSGSSFAGEDPILAAARDA
jgi:hypothetical protein